MTQVTRDRLYRRHRFPAEVIAHAVWLYLRFPLSLRMVEDLLAARGYCQVVCHWMQGGAAPAFSSGHFCSVIGPQAEGICPGVSPGAG